MAETERPQFIQAAARLRVGQLEFAQHVTADDAEVTDAFGDQRRNVVVANQQEVHRLALAETEQLVAALTKFQAAACEELLGGFGQSTGLLHGDTQTIARLHAAPATLRRAAAAM